jgi:hypothetical protein
MSGYLCIQPVLPQTVKHSYRQHNLGTRLGSCLDLEDMRKTDNLAGNGTTTI